MKLGAVKLRKFLDRQDPRKKPSHFARDIGTFPSTVHRILSGKNNPDLATATEIEVQTKGEVTRDDWLVDAPENKSKK